jgi:diaminopimelate decarboxylase
VARTVGDLGCRLIFEPGRLIVGNAGILLTRVIRVKAGATRTFVIVDAGMNDLLRPALYDARHAIDPVIQPAADQPLTPVDVVGPICETSDSFASAMPLPPVQSGSLLAIRTAGAYGAVMASAYNVRPIVAEVLVRDGVFAVVHERIGVEDLLERQPLPTWLADEPAAPEAVTGRR